MSYNDQVQAGNTESAGVRAVQDARRKVIEHIGSASKELGNIAAQYGKIIGNYQAELHQLDASLAVLRPSTVGGNAQQVQAPSAY